MLCGRRRSCPGRESLNIFHPVTNPKPSDILRLSLPNRCCEESKSKTSRVSSNGACLRNRGSAYPLFLPSPFLPFRLSIVTWIAKHFFRMVKRAALVPPPFPPSLLLLFFNKTTDYYTHHLYWRMHFFLCIYSCLLLFPFRFLVLLSPLPTFFPSFLPSFPPSFLHIATSSFFLVLFPPPPPPIPPDQEGLKSKATVSIWDAVPPPQPHSSVT
jgi:hypothetical protein